MRLGLGDYFCGGGGDGGLVEKVESNSCNPMDYSPPGSSVMIGLTTASPIL